MRFLVTCYNYILLCLSQLAQYPHSAGPKQRGLENLDWSRSFHFRFSNILGLLWFSFFSSGTPCARDLPMGNSIHRWMTKYTESGERVMSLLRIVQFGVPVAAFTFTMG